MTLSRSLPAALALAALGAPALGAQSRFTVTPIAGYGTTSPVVDDVVRTDVLLATTGGETVTGQHVRSRKYREEPAPAVGARVESAFGRWTGSVTATYSRTDMRYDEVVYAIDPRPGGWTIGPWNPPRLSTRMTGDIVTLGLGVGRRLPLAGPFSLDAGAGAGARWLARGKVTDYGCTTEAQLEWCHIPYRRDNVLPEANASLALRTRLGGGVSLEVRGTGWSGVSSTRSFIYRIGVPAQTDWAPSAEQERKAPPLQHVYSSLLSVGLSFKQ